MARMTHPDGKSGEAAGHEHEGAWAAVAPAEYWHRRYSESGAIWSGRVNTTLAAVAAELTPGRALDLGCGEGADAIWLAQRGWRTLGIDIATSAIDRARQAAQAAGLTADQIRFVAADLSDVDHDDSYDLVAASFLHSPVELPRVDILRSSAGLVAADGHLLVIGHAAAPPWADSSAHEHRFLSAAEELDALDLDMSGWETVIAETRTRTSLGPDEKVATLDDTVLLLRRR
jgi:SAM-dependent methyltransferase